MTIDIWDNRSTLTLGNGANYNADWILNHFGFNKNEKILLFVEDNKVIEISLLQVYLDKYNIPHGRNTTMLNNLKEAINNEELEMQMNGDTSGID